MRYHFRGLKRDAGTPVEGHVEALNEPAAYQLLGDHGIVTESLRPAPSASPPPNGTPSPGQQPSAPGGGNPWDIAGALENALNTASHPVSVYALAQRFRGKQVWAIDREKIKQHVMQIIDTVIQQSSERKESHEEIRDRMAEAVERMFKDNRNLASQVNQQGSEAMERQIARLSRVVTGLERAVGNIATVLRSGGGGGGGPARFNHEQRERNEEQQAVLLEIFETNLEMQRRLEEKADGAASVAADVAAEPSPEGGNGSAGDAAKPPPAS